MSNDMIKFEDAVKDRIKSIVGELIPEDRWQAIVASTVAKFERDDLPALVRTELTKMYGEKIRAELNGSEWQAKWDNSGNAVASEMVKKLLIDSAPLVLANMIGGAVQQTILNLQQNLRSY